jgi:hypothetical protein
LEDFDGESATDGIDVSDSGITNSGLKLLIAGISSKSIKFLYLSFNLISDHGATILSEYLKENQTLIMLYLSNNKIANDGF